MIKFLLIISRGISFLINHTTGNIRTKMIDSIQNCQQEFIYQKDGVNITISCQKIEEDTKYIKTKKTSIIRPSNTQNISTQPDTLTQKDCSNICNRLRPTNETEHQNCITSCTSEIAK